MFGHHDDSQTYQNPVPEEEQVVVSPDEQVHDSGQAQGDDWQHPGIPADDGLSAPHDNPTAVTPHTDDPVNDQTDQQTEPAHEQDHQKEPGHTEPAPESPIPPRTPNNVFDVTGPAGDFNPPTPPADDTSDPLIDIKQKALSQLSPLVDHLDQSPEDRFRTLMMLIQSSDDHSLLKEAYGAAEKIEDKKVRAQALLEVVHEINYFTQPHPDA